MKYVSLFAGLGGFDTAFNRYGGECVLASEIDEKTKFAYQTIYGHLPEGDVTKINSQDVPDHDVLLAGFPCPTFSQAGRRDGMDYKCNDCGHEHLVTFREYIHGAVCPKCSGHTEPKDIRGLLFYEVARIAEYKQPKFLLLENVKGLVSHNKGKTLETILFTLNEIGFRVDFQILNSKFFNVPQSRERIFIVATNILPHEAYEIPSKKNVFTKAKERLLDAGLQTFRFPWPTNDTVTTCIQDILEKNVEDSFYINDAHIHKFIAKISETDSDIQKIGYLGKDREQYRVHDTNGVMPTITANNSGGRRPGGLILEGNPKGRIVKSVAVDRAVNTGGVIFELENPEGRIGGWVVRDDRIFAFQQDKKRSTVQEHVYHRENSLTDTLSTAHVPKIITHNIPEIVKVRKHEVDVPALQTLLRSAKKDSGLSNKQIASQLNLPLTHVEHWFRTDHCFSIPQPEHWEPLKNLLGITTSTFDAPVTEFIEREGTYEKSQRVYDSKGLTPTLTSTSANEKILHGGRIRRLTGLECLRLQAFPDEYYEKLKAVGMSNSQIYKMAGNAVTVSVIESLAKEIKELLNQ